MRVYIVFCEKEQIEEVIPVQEEGVDLFVTLEENVTIFTVVSALKEVFPDVDLVITTCPSEYGSLSIGVK